MQDSSQQLDKHVPNDGARNITIISILYFHAKIYYRWSYEWFYQRIVNIILPGGKRNDTYQ